jgi:uncharacterized membrane protein
MRKWIPAFVIGATYLFSAWAFRRLPERVSLRWDALFPGFPATESDVMSRGFAAFLIPTLALVIWLLLRGAASKAAERLGKRVMPAWLVSDRTGAEAFERFGPTFDVIVLLVVGFISLLHVVVLGSTIGWGGWAAQGFAVVIGVGIMVLGNIMPRTRPNWVAGLRTKRTLSDPDLWRRTHRFFGALLMVTGAAVIGVSLISAPYALLLAAVGLILSSLLASALGSRAAAPAGP